MTRVLGEKSYYPGTFRLSFWGDRNHYGNMFRRKLPGSIVLAAYHVPMRAEELSLELGVAMPYLEDELETLKTAGLLRRVAEKYQSNLIILTDDYEKDFVQRTAHVYAELSEKIFEMARAILPQVRALPFKGNDMDDNRMLIGLLNIAMMEAYQQAGEISPLGEPPALPLGGHGWLFGYDYDDQNHHFQGITMHSENRAHTAWFLATNYRVFLACQEFKHFRFNEKIEAMCDAILEKRMEDYSMYREELLCLMEDGFISQCDGKLSTNFPVFTPDIYAKLCRLLSPISTCVATCMIEISEKAERILRDLVPASVQNQCGDIAKIHHRMDVAAFLMEKLIHRGDLTLPNEQVPVCVFGVKK